MYIIYTISMQTKIIFNADAKLKKAVTAKARAQGLNLSDVLNLAARAYVADTIVLGAFDAKLAASVAQADAGKFISAATVRRKLRLR